MIKHIPQGYKDSPLGIIPKEWEVKRLGDVCSKITDGTHGTPQKQDIGVPYLTAIHVKDGAIDYDNCYFLTQEDHNEIYQRCNPEYGDVLMVNIGAGVGSVAMNKVKYEFSLKNVALLKPNKKILTGYFLESYLLTSKRKNIHRLLNGGAQPFWGLDDIARIHILLPSLVEQNRLESVISLWDTAIEKQSILIEKLKLRKRALMQQLLTGKKRLPGFSGEWKEVKFGEIAKIIGGGTPSTTVSEYWDGGIPWFTPSEIGHKKYLSISERTISDIGLCNSSAKILPKGTILFTSRATIGLKAILTISATTNQGFQSIIMLDENSNEFFYYYLDIILNEIRQKASGSTFPEISAESIRKISIKISSKKEQNAIASVLVNADKEIELANEKVANLQSQKRGLMQQLLSGKKRIIE